MNSRSEFKRPLNSFMIYRTVVHNYLKANNVKYSSNVISKLASNLWKNESAEIKNAYKKLAETTKCYKKNLKTKNITSNEKPVFLNIHSESIYVQSPAFSFNINSPTVIISTQTLIDIQYNLIIVPLH
ncbi:10740_t:CDS:1 [Dentiscutata erythropus]|uniref:10740_t:CDS:1 n=1 Tax=Dentiscutata erythropus TaxID=1348616 RepID=A0A9N9I4L9_9GLOM|nr:10740_t:CDS:1 [Dentiscutata erythropus]